MNLVVDLFLYYLYRILEKGLFQLEESNVRIAEKMSGQMFEKRLQICNVIVQPCAAWWDFGLVLFWHGLLTVFMIRYIDVLIVTVTLKLMIKTLFLTCVRSFNMYLTLFLTWRILRKRCLLLDQPASFGLNMLKISSSYKKMFFWFRKWGTFIKIQPPIHIFFHLYLNATVSSYPCPLGLVPK